MTGSRRTLQLSIAAGALILAGLIVRSCVRRPSPEQAVAAAVRTFCEGVETRQINRSLRTVSSRFGGDGYNKADLVRGLWSVNRDFERISIYIADLDIAVAPDQEHAEAVVKVAIVGDRGGQDVTIGQDEPITVTVTYQREGRAWRVVKAVGIPTLGYGY